MQGCSWDRLDKIHTLSETKYCQGSTIRNLVPFPERDFRASAERSEY